MEGVVHPIWSIAYSI